METIAPYLKGFWQYFLAMGKMLLDSFVEGIVTATESFDKQDNRTYKASFGEERELLSSSHGGFCLTGSDEGCLSRIQSFDNVMVIGAIGTGKTASIVINTAMRIKNASMIINCPSGQTRGKVAAYLEKEGFQVDVIKWDAPYDSSSFNIFDYLNTKSEYYKAAHIIAEGLKPGSGDNFWQLQTTIVLYVFISITATQPKPVRNMANVKFLLNRFMTDPTSLDKLFIKWASDELMEEFKGIITMEEKVLKSVLASAQAALALWFDDAVCKSTSVSTFRLEDLRKKPCCIFVENPTYDSKIYAPLNSLFFSFVIRSLMSRLPEKGDLDVFIIIDEASTIRIELGDILNNNRKYRCGLMTLWQSQEQIDHVFGLAEAESIRNASLTKVFLSGAAGLKGSKELEDLLGRTEYVDGAGKTKIKPLLTAEEVRLMNPQEAIILSANMRPLKVKMHPYFKQHLLQVKMNLPPFQYINRLVPKTIPLIQLSNEKAKTK